PQLDRGCRVDFLFGNEYDAHSPAGVGLQHSAEVTERQLRLVDLNRHLAVGTAVVDLAAYDPSPGHPLICVLGVLDLGSSGRYLDCQVGILGGMLRLRNEDTVPEIQDLLVRHGPEARAY